MLFIFWSGDSGSSFATLQQPTPSLVWRDILDAKMELLLLNYVAILVRVARQQRQCQLFLQRCVERRHWLHYCFCYYYGGHARHLSSWLLAAGTLYCLWNDVLRWPLPGVYIRVCVSVWCACVYILLSSPCMSCACVRVCECACLCVCCCPFHLHRGLSWVFRPSHLYQHFEPNEDNIRKTR